MDELTPVTAAEIAKISDISEISHIKKMAEAAEVFYKAQDAMLEASKAQEIKLRAIRQAGIILLPPAQGGMTPREQGKRTDGTSSTSLSKFHQTLDEAGISEQTAGVWQKVARVPENTFEHYLAEADYYQDEITITGLLKFAGTWYGPSNKADWETPQWLFDILNDEFHFTVDVCALPDNTKCPVYFTPDDDGLEQEWTGTCWMNPPYGREIKAWMEKAAQAAQNGATVVCLVPARTDTEWWWENCIQHEIRFLKGRLEFVGGESSAPFPSAVVIMRSGAGDRAVWWNVGQE